MSNAADTNKILERISALYDGEDLPQGRLDAETGFKEARQSLQRWSVIGATLRHESFASVDTSFADRVAASIAALPISEQPLKAQVQADPDFSVVKNEVSENKIRELKVDQSEVSQKPQIDYVAKVRQIFFRAGQLAAAAAVAAITVVGYQFYNAGSVAGIVEPAADATLGPVGGVNLASYQNDGQDVVIRMNQFEPQQNVNAAEQTQPRNVDAKEMQKLREQEFQKINAYLRGYVLDTAARH